jgi:RNA polymerase sigma factor (sigma-70 family)
MSAVDEAAAALHHQASDALARCRALLGPQPPAGRRAWDAQIREALPGNPAAAEQWATAERAWWALALHKTTDIVRSEARRQIRRAVERYRVEDLEQAAWLGVYRAAQSWDPVLGSSWRSYAGDGARRGIMNHMRNGQTEFVKYSEVARMRRWELNRDLEDQARNGSAPDRRAAAARLGVSLEYVDDLLAGYRVTHLDAPLRGPDADSGIGHEVVGVVGFEERDIDHLDAAKLHRQICQLDAADQELIRTVLAGAKIADLARAAGISKKTMHERYRRAVTRLARLYGIDESVSLTARGSTSDAAAQILRRTGRPMTATEIARMLGRTSSQATTALDRVGSRVPGTRRPTYWVAR